MAGRFVRGVGGSGPRTDGTTAGSGHTPTPQHPRPTNIENIDHVSPWNRRGQEDDRSPSRIRDTADRADPTFTLKRDSAASREEAVPRGSSAAEAKAEAAWRSPGGGGVGRRRWSSSSISINIREGGGGCILAPPLDDDAGDRRRAPGGGVFAAVMVRREGGRPRDLFPAFSFSFSFSFRDCVLIPSRFGRILGDTRTNQQKDLEDNGKE